MLAGTLLVIVLYLGVSAVILYGAPQEQLRGVAESGAVAARALGGARAEQALGLLIALALVTSASSMILSGPRVYARMAQDEAFPSMLGRLHGDHPRIAILAQAALSLMVVWAAGLRELLDFVGVTLSLSAGAVVVAWLHRRSRRSRSPRPVLKIGAAGFFLAVTSRIAAATLAMRPASAIVTAILIGCGLAVHALGQSRTSALKNSS